MAEALKEIIGLDEIKVKKVEDDLCAILEHTRGELEEVGVDNPDYDAELAMIGKEDKESAEVDEKSKQEKEKKEVKKEKIEKIEKKEELTNEDLNDVFWEDKEQPHPWIPSPLEEKEAAKWNFNENNFINKLKENWAKWGLTMNLRWAWISIIWSEFIISTKTNFAKKQIETGDNLAIIQKTLADMWYDDIQVIIK